MSGGFLAEMARAAAERVARAKALVSERAMLERARAAPAAPRLRLSAEGFDLIAELKLRSPAAGPLGGVAEDLLGRVRSYARAGVAAVSVLTEPTRFDGSLEHLHAAAQALQEARVPAMRKDFLVDPYQVLEARAAGAGGVLVILRMLTGTQLDALLDCARELELFVLLEAFDADDIERSHTITAARSVPGSDAAALLVGVNCRDLATLEVVPGRLQQLAPLLPQGVPRVAESGVAAAADAASVAAANYQLALVGSALMRGRDPAALAQDLIRAGRHAAAARTLARRANGTAPARSA